MVQLGAILALATVAVSNSIIGVAPEKQHLYKISEEGIWSCLLDPSIVLLESQINDNLCDCPDGSDEPGTNACEFTSENPIYFYCHNDGYFPRYIENYKVNDGVCDYDLCCDGSDEWASGHCENKCAAVRKQYDEYMNIKTTAVEKASKVKQELVQKARQAKETLSDTLTKLKEQVAKDSVSLEMLENSLKGAELHFESDESSLSLSLVDELNSYVSEVEAKFASLSSSTSKQQQRIGQLENMLANLVKNYNPNFNDLSVKQCVKQFEEYVSNRPNEEEQPTIDGFKASMVGFAQKLKSFLPVQTSQLTIVPSVSNLLHHYYGQLISSFKPAASDQDETKKTDKPKVTSKTINAFKEKIEAVQKKLKSQQAEISIHEENLNRGYGEDDILRSVEGQWVSKKIGEYTYKLGFLDTIYQDNTLIGRFINFDGSSLHFAHGSKCWNGPHRSAIVETICGPVNELISVSEPEKCQYKFILESPIACSPLTEEQIASGFKVDLSKL